MSSTHCALCTGKVGLLPNATSVTCPHCGASLAVSREYGPVRLVAKEGFAEDVENDETRKRMREEDEYDLRLKISRREHEEYSRHLPQIAQAVTLIAGSMICVWPVFSLGNMEKGLSS